MDLIYIDEAGDDVFGPSNTNHFALSAICVPEENWQTFFEILADWRRSISRRFGIYYRVELHASEFLRGGQSVGRRTVPRAVRAHVFREALNLLEREGRQLGVWVTNVCLKNEPGIRNYEVALDRMLNRLERTLKAKGNRAVEALRRELRDLANGPATTFTEARQQATRISNQSWSRRGVVICDQGHDRLIRSVSRRLKVFNPIPSMMGGWGVEREPYKHVPLEHLVADPFSRDSRHDRFIQLADFVAFALLKSFEPPTSRVARYKLDSAFEILDEALNKNAAYGHPKGVVRN